MRRIVVGIGTLIVVCLLALTWTTVLRGQSAGQETIATMLDITSTGATVTPATSGTARWVQITAAPTNATLVPWGGLGTIGTQGSLVVAGGGQFLLPPQMNQNVPDSELLLAVEYLLYIASADKVSVTYDQ